MKKPLFKQLAMTAGALLLAGNALAITFPDEPTQPTNPTTPTNPGNSGDVRGPDPTAQALEARRGPYSVQTKSVRSPRGFGGGTIHYPTGVSGKMGAIAVVPGFVSYENSIEWWGPRLASWGFVVITMDTNSGYDQPDSRARQLSAALDYVIADSTVGGMIDSSRLGVVGWSMGGGGTMKLSTDRRLKAIIPQAPWYASASIGRQITTPAFFIACGADTIAPVRQHVDPFYNNTPNSTSKMYLEVRGASHYCGNSRNDQEDLLGKVGVSWMKRYIDGDTRFEPFLCATNYESDRRISEQRNNCKF